MQISLCDQPGYIQVMVWMLDDEFGEYGVFFLNIRLSWFLLYLRWEMRRFDYLSCLVGSVFVELWCFIKFVSSRFDSNILDCFLFHV